MRNSIITALSLATFCVAPQALAQANYPTKPITLVVPYAPGNTDVLARVFLGQMGQNTKWTFTYDYKPGASSKIGTTAVAKAAPDGHTMLVVASTITYSHLLKNKPPYDWRRDLEPVYQLNRTNGILMVNPKLPVNSVREYIAYAKANPGKINYATIGNGGIVHIVAENMHHQMGVQVTYVPYKGYGNVTSAIIAGEVQAAHPAWRAFGSFLTSGKVRPLALTGANSRLAQLPNLKSIAEEGVPTFDNWSWTGIFFPGNTPGAIINRMNAEFTKARLDPETIKKLDGMGEGPGGGTPEEFRRFLNETSERLTKVIQDAGIELEE